jgi:hypothetical protein
LALDVDLTLALDDHVKIICAGERDECDLMSNLLYKGGAIDGDE